MTEQPDPLKDSIARAISARADCAKPETFLRERWARLDEDERQRIERHLERCAACTAERKLAGVYDEFDETEAVPSADERFVIARLAELDAHAEGAARPGGATRGFGAHLDWRLGSAAALVVVVILGASAWRSWISGAPELPAPPPQSVSRGVHVQLEFPAGDLDESPQEFRWVGLAKTDRYRVRLIQVDGNSLWETTTTVPGVALPEAVTRSMNPAVTYRWNVEAYDSHGALLAVSETLAFRVRTSAALDTE